MTEQTLTEIHNDLAETQQALLGLLNRADDQNMLYRAHVQQVTDILKGQE